MRASDRERWFEAAAHRDGAWERHPGAVGVGGVMADASTTPRPTKPVGAAGTVHYEIRSTSGDLVAIHERVNLPNGGKRLRWRLPNGRYSRGHIKSSRLPLYGSEQAPRWNRQRPVVVAEGEKAADAIRAAGWQAVGTVCGAPQTPCDEALDVLAGYHVCLWADNDEAGYWHMIRIASRLWHARSLRWAARSDAGPKEDAANCPPELVSGVIRTSTPLCVPVRPAKLDSHDAVPLKRHGPIAQFNAKVPVSEVLVKMWGIPRHIAVPGTTIRCAAHDDRNPSLSVFSDDRRVRCWSEGCELWGGGRGHDAWSLHALALSRNGES